MYFHSLSSFLQMGGYAFYVWPAYAVVCAGMVFVSWRMKRRLRRQLKGVS